MNVLLDTHVVLWWQAGGDRLTRAATRAINTAGEILISPLTCWEIATLHRLGRIELDRDPQRWTRDLLAGERIAEAPLTPEAAAWAGGLASEFPGDPIDRLLYGTARDLRVPLITKDDRLRAAADALADVRVIW
jgi:PIN domain nuclease of toxin-antitoxin system